MRRFENAARFMKPDATPPGFRDKTPNKAFYEMHILLIKPSSLGDVVHAMPVVSDLKRADPRCRVSWLVNRSLAPLARMVRGVDAVIVFDRNAWKSPARFPANLREAAKLAVLLRKERFDVALDLQGLFRSALIGFFSGARSLIGFENAREGASFFYHQTIPVSRPPAHAVDRNRAALSVILPGFDAGPARFEIDVPAAASQSVSALLRQAGVHGEYAVLCPAARWTSKEWPRRSFVELAARLRDALGLSVVVAGDRSLAGEWDALAGKCPPGVVSLAGQTSLPELAALLSGGRFTVSNDSGPMHLSTAMGIRTYVLMGPTRPERTGPYRNARVIREQPECSPCLRRVCAHTGRGGKCLESISAGRVTGIILEETAAHRGGRPQ